MNFMKRLGTVGLVLGMLAMTAGVYAAPVNINKADAKTLAKNIKGVGPAKAQAIVIYRRDNGPFKSVRDLAKVKGIGERLIVTNKANLMLTDAALSKRKK